MAITSSAVAGRGLAVGGITFGEIRKTELKISQTALDATSSASIAANGKWKKYIPGMAKASATCSGNWSAADVLAAIDAINNGTVVSLTWDPDGAGTLWTLDSAAPEDIQVDSETDGVVSGSIGFFGGKVS